MQKGKDVCCTVVTGQFFVTSTRRSRITLSDSRNLKLPGGFFHTIYVFGRKWCENQEISQWKTAFLVSFELNGKRNAVEKVGDKQYRRGDIGEPGRELSCKGYLLLGYWTANWGDERGCTFDGLAIISWLRFAFVSRSSWIQCEDSLPWKSALMFIFVQPRSL